MRLAAMLPFATGTLMIAVLPALAQGQAPRTQAPGYQAQQPQRPPQPQGGAPRQAPPQQQAMPQPAPPKPYQPVSIGAPPVMKDPALEAFRKQIGDIAGKKDRAALAKHVAMDFFWLGEKGDRADKKRPGIDNLVRALHLNAKEGHGWEALAGFASDPTAMAIPIRKDTVCAPADPAFEVKELENLAKQTGTNEAEWGFPAQPGIEVRASAQLNAPVTEKLGMHLVRVMEPDAAEPPAGQMPMLKVVTPSGKVGYVPADTLSPLGSDQLCYVKDGVGWKIAGFVGGEPE